MVLVMEIITNNSFISRDFCFDQPKTVFFEFFYVLEVIKFLIELKNETSLLLKHCSRIFSATENIKVG